MSDKDTLRRILRENDDLRKHQREMLRILTGVFWPLSWKSWVGPDLRATEGYFWVGITTPRGEVHYQVDEAAWSDFRVVEKPYISSKKTDKLQVQDVIYRMSSLELLPPVPLTHSEIFSSIHQMMKSLNEHFPLQKMRHNITLDEGEDCLVISVWVDEEAPMAWNVPVTPDLTEEGKGIPEFIAMSYREYMEEEKGDG